MKKILIIFAVVIVFGLSVGVGGASYVWWRLTSPTMPTPSVPTTTTSSENTTSEDSSGGVSGGGSAQVPVTISKDQLTPEQRALADKFGIDTSTVTITPAMISCAKDALGTERFNAITQGGTPTPLEALSLIPCLK